MLTWCSASKLTDHALSGPICVLQALQAELKAAADFTSRLGVQLSIKQAAVNAAEDLLAAVKHNAEAQVVRHGRLMEWHLQARDESWQREIDSLQQLLQDAQAIAESAQAEVAEHKRLLATSLVEVNSLQCGLGTEPNKDTSLHQLLTEADCSTETAQQHDVSRLEQPLSEFRTAAAQSEEVRNLHTAREVFLDVIDMLLS